MLTTFIRKKAGHYNISEMSIVFGIAAILAILPVLAIGAILYYLLGASNAFAVITAMILWFGFVGWLWLSFVLTGRQSPHERVSTGELTAMQVICTVVAGLHVLFSAPQERHIWEVIGSTFEWVIVGFHIIYFTLAWAMKARVPVRTYVMFALILGFMLLRPR